MKKSCILLFLITNFVAAQWFISQKEIIKQGIYYRTLMPAILSQKGDFFIAYSELSAKEKYEGFVYLLNVYRLKAKNKVEVSQVKLPIFFMVGMALTNNDKSLIIVGNYGTKIIKVDLKTLKLKTIFQHKKGIEAFRTETLVVGWKNKILLSGYFYDKEQYALANAVAGLTSSGTFKKHMDLDEIYRQLGTMPKWFQLISHQTAYFGYLNYQKRQTYLYRYHNEKLTLVAKGYALGGFAGGKDRIFYTLRANKKSRRSYVKDFKTGKLWEVGEKHIPYTYPFISKNDNVILTSTINIFTRTMQVYYAKFSENYKLKPLLEAPVGIMKISGNGKRFLYMEPKGIKVGIIP